MAPDVLLVDANVLVHAVNQSSRDHAVARDWLRGALLGSEAVAFDFDRDFARFDGVDLLRPG